MGDALHGVHLHLRVRHGPYGEAGEADERQGVCQGQARQPRGHAVRPPDARQRGAGHNDRPEPVQPDAEPGPEAVSGLPTASTRRAEHNRAKSDSARPVDTAQKKYASTTSNPPACDPTFLWKHP